MFALKLVYIPYKIIMSHVDVQVQQNIILKRITLKVN